MLKILLSIAIWLVPAGVLRADNSGAVRTANFAVEAPTPQIAATVARAAERLRREKAIEWLGRELPAWPAPCPIRVSTTFNGYSHTDFAPDNSLRAIVLEGALDHVLDDTLPHEMSHAVLVPNVGFELPCWADEGAAVLGSSEYDRDRFDDLLYRYYASEHFIPLARLFRMTGYPPDWAMMYAEGYSITSFLVRARDRRTFLAFVAAGTRDGWDQAVARHYGHASVAELERAWLATLAWTGRKIVPRQPGTRLRYTQAGSGKVIDVATLEQETYTVVREQGDWIKVRHRRGAGWLDKADALLLEKAVGYYTRKARLRPRDAEALAFRGLAWLEKGKPERAVRDLDAAIASAPQQAAWYLHRGRARVHNGQYLGAVLDFAEAAARHAPPP